MVETRRQVTNLGKARKIDESEGEDMGRVDAETDGKRRNPCGHESQLWRPPTRAKEERRRTCVLARLRLRIRHDLVTNLVKVVELLSRAMELSRREGQRDSRCPERSPTHELCPLIRVARHIRGRLRACCRSLLAW